MLPKGGPMKTINSIKYKKDNPGFMFYKDDTEDSVIEWCSTCCYEVSIKNIAEKQVCPMCGEIITPCSPCDHNRVNCSQCILI